MAQITPTRITLSSALAALAAAVAAGAAALSAAGAAEPAAAVWALEEQPAIMLVNMSAARSRETTFLTFSIINPHFTGFIKTNLTLPCHEFGPSDKSTETKKQSHTAPSYAGDSIAPFVVLIGFIIARSSDFASAIFYKFIIL